MKHCINLPSHVGKQSHVFSCSCQRKPNSEYRNPYFSSHSLIARPNLCKNLPTNAMFSFKLGSEDNGAVKSLPVLWRSKAFPYIALPPPGVGSSAFFSQYFYTADTFCQDRYRNSVCTFQGPEDTHRTWLTWTAPRTLFHACSALDLDLHVSSGLGNHGGLGSVIGQPVYSPTSAALDYQQVFLGRLWTYMLGALSPVPPMQWSTLASVLACLVECVPLAPLWQQFSLSLILASSFSFLSTYFFLAFNDVKSSDYSLMGGQRAANNTWRLEFRSQVFLDCHLGSREKENSRNPTYFLLSPLQVSLQCYYNSTTYV